MQPGSFTLSIKNQFLILIIIAFGLNANTLFNEYVLDDAIVITENKFVEKGIQGIPEILNQSYFKGYKKLENLELPGGRYRPFSLMIFAIEYQFFGANPFVSHLINIILFLLLIALLFKLFNLYLFRQQNPYLAFVTCLLFAVHPIHTEVIANVKSRDEIITFVLLIASLLALIKHSEKRSISILIVSLLCFFLALLTKETAAVFVGIAPLATYFFLNHPLKKSARASIPLFLILIGYLFIRYIIIGVNYTSANDITNVPYLYATASEAFATKSYMLIKYLQLLFIPYPLSFEYGFNQIPYIHIISLPFFISILFLLVLLAYAIYTFKRRSIFSFSILYFMLTISLASNFIIDTGTPLSERLLFQPSLAFCIAVSVLYFQTAKRFKLPALSFLIIILVLFSVKTVLRNSVWKNYDTLVLTDVISCPNSVRINQFARDIFLSKSINEKNAELKISYLKKGTFYGERMIGICPEVPDIYMNLGYAYYNLSDYNQAATIWEKGCQLEPSDSAAKMFSKILSDELYKLANGFYEQGKSDDAINCYLRSIELNNNNAESWYNLGGNYFLRNDTINANKAWARVKYLDPKHKFLKEDFSKI